jgi:predicted HTH domain antitoxin
MSVTISDETLEALHATPEDVWQGLAVWLYQQEKISLGRAAELCGMSQWDLEQMLAARGVYSLYGPQDLEQDLDTVRGIPTG